jgi:predicted acylesterase/phospholipase RssA
MISQASHAEKIQIGPKKKIAFVCSGGATKAGAFHLGVALALQEHGFKFVGGLNPSPGALHHPAPMEISTYVGSSAGSVIASYLAAGYSLENIFNAFLNRKPTDPKDTLPRVLPRLSYNAMFRLRAGLAREQIGQLAFLRMIYKAITEGDFQAILQLRWIKATGLFSTAGVEQFMREDVLPSNHFKDYIADLFIVATQLNHSRKVVFGKYSFEPPPSDLTCQYDSMVPISDACAGSTALPFIYAPYSIKNANGEENFYIDGEVRDTLSSHVAIDAGCDLVFASYTLQPYHYQKETGSLTQHGLPAILIQSLFLVIEQKINQHIHSKITQRKAINEVEAYCNQVGLADEHKKMILSILERELYHKRNVDTIYIHPDPEDEQMFFGEHFTLSQKKLAEYVKRGFKAGALTLKKYHFADRKVEAKIQKAEGSPV